MDIKWYLTQLRHLPGLVALVSFYGLLFLLLTAEAAGRGSGMAIPILLIVFGVNIGIGFFAGIIYAVRYEIYGFELSDHVFSHLLSAMYSFGLSVYVLLAVLAQASNLQEQAGWLFPLVASVLFIGIHWFAINKLWTKWYSHRTNNKKS